MIILSIRQAVIYQKNITKHHQSIITYVG